MERAIDKRMDADENGHFHIRFVDDFDCDGRAGNHPFYIWCAERLF